ncbi:hypothetical protein ACVGWX_00860, partial [Enterobacter hormaechei]
ACVSVVDNLAFCCRVAATPYPAYSPAHPPPDNFLLNFNSGTPVALFNYANAVWLNVQPCRTSMDLR